MEFDEIRELVPKFGILINNGVLSFVINNDDNKPIVQDFCEETGNKELLESLMWNSREIDISLEPGKSVSFIDFVMSNSDLINGKFYFLPFSPEKSSEEIYNEIVNSGSGEFDPHTRENLLRCFEGVDLSNDDEIRSALQELENGIQDSEADHIPGFTYVQRWVYLRKLLVWFEKRTGIPVMIADPIDGNEYGFGEFQLSESTHPKNVIQDDFLVFIRKLVFISNVVSIEAGKIDNESVINFTFFA